MGNKETRKCQKLLIVISFSIILYFCGIYAFVNGLMPYHANTSYRHSMKNLPKEPHTEKESFHLYKRRYKRMIFILIDALRADFFDPQSNFFNITPFRNVKKLLNDQYAIWLISRAYSPTVTLPRIKSLLSGTLSGYSDVLTNFNAKELLNDNWISQAKASNLKVLFYGDDTWIKLYPQNYFYRYEGIHSFYVKDYKDVDNNVTRHLPVELQKNDWDIMVLHYLGVDHIGHAYGPYSPILPKKLNEMDDIILQLFKGLQDDDSQKVKDFADLVVVCGDHGMTIGGNHGGSSESEVLTPLVFITTKRIENTALFSLSDEVSQVDVSTTLSVLLGLPIPSDSMGIIIPDALSLSGMSPREVLYAAFYNSIHLGFVYQQAFKKDPSQTPEFLEIVQRHKSWLKSYLINGNKSEDANYAYLLKVYMRHLYLLKTELLVNAKECNEVLMVVGIVMTWMSLVLNFVLVVQWKINRKNSPSICYMFLNFFIVIILSAVLILYDYIISLYFLMAFVTVPYILWLVLALWTMATNRERIQAFFMILPMLSLGSSSFIEEEHLTWYFLTSTCFYLFIFHILYYQNVLKAIDRSVWQQISDIVQLLVVHRVLRSWNQTGNKWIHLSDIQDWITQDQNSLLLHILMFLSFFVLLLSFKNNNLIISFITLSGLTWSYINKCHDTIIQYLNESFQGFHIVYFHSFLLFIIALYKCISNVFCSNYQTCIQNRKSFMLCLISSWTLIVTAVSRDYNIPLIAATFIQESLLYRHTWKKDQSDFLNCTLYLMMAISSFFYIGNSNSLATIDVFAGYTGITAYQPVVVAFLLICNTYSCYIIWIMMAIYRILHALFISKKEVICWHLAICCYGFLLYRMFMLVITMMLVNLQKYHLFILSVFVPKLFYEISHTILSLFIWMIITSICL